MSSPTLIGIGIAIFCITALLYFQSKEGFENVPADLNRAPVSKPIQTIPGNSSLKTTTPTIALATRSELAELDSKLMTWLDAASQREVGNPTALSEDQRQKRVLYQARVSAIRQQLGTGLIVDSSKDVSAQILQLRTENAGWQSPNYVVSDFATTADPTAFLTMAQYKEFRSIMLQTIKSLQTFQTSDPLMSVRQKQLEQIDSELRPTDLQGILPPIRVGSARDFLGRMLQSTQPLPTLISMAPMPTPSLVSNPLDIIRQVQSIPNPPIKLVKLAEYLSTGNPSTESVVKSRNIIWSDRANTLCSQLREAFPEKDAEALGCPKHKIPKDNEGAENLVYTVCNRIKESVPSITPEQFNCPKV